MYGWYNDEKEWRDPAKIKGQFGSAKAPYLKDFADAAAKEGPRTYASGKFAPDMGLVDPKGKNIILASDDDIVMLLDGTASMAKWPKEVHDREPLYVKTIRGWREQAKICFGIIGDAKWDTWAFQIGNPGNGPELDKVINGLYAEGKGGPGYRESYELGAYFALKHIQVPEGVHPTLIVIGDEMFYDDVDPEHVKKIFGDVLPAPLPSLQVWKDLGQRFDIYHLRKQYGQGLDDKIEAQWTEALGPQRIIPVYNNGRFEVIDVALGIQAKKWGCEDNFLQNLEARQEGAAVASVMASLKYAPGMSGSIANAVGKPSVKKSKKLVEE